MVRYGAVLMKMLGIRATSGKLFKDICYMVLRSLPSAGMAIWRASVRRAKMEVGRG